MKTEIMSGSSCLECLFFMSCRSWQKASRFWGQGKRGTQQLVRDHMNLPILTLPQGHPDLWQVS